MGGEAKIPKSFVPAVLFPGVMLAFFIWLIVWLFAGCHFFVEIIVDSLMVKHCA